MCRRFFLRTGQRPAITPDLGRVPLAQGRLTADKPPPGAARGGRPPWRTRRERDEVRHPGDEQICTMSEDRRAEQPGCGRMIHRLKDVPLRRRPAPKGRCFHNFLQRKRLSHCPLAERPPARRNGMKIAAKQPAHSTERMRREGSTSDGTTRVKRRTGRYAKSDSEARNWFPMVAIRRWILLDSSTDHGEGTGLWIGTPTRRTGGVGECR